MPIITAALVTAPNLANVIKTKTLCHKLAGIELITRENHLMQPTDKRLAALEIPLILSL